MRRALVRCDGTPEGGLGHLVRALAVAERAREVGWSVTFAGTVTSGFGRDLVRRAGVEVVPAAGDLGELAARYAADLVHVDDYLVGTEARRQVAGAGAVLCSMEDGTFGRRPADVVVDSAMGAEEPGSPSLARPDDGSGRVLRGIAYAPLRAEVLAARERRATTADPAGGTGVDVLVVMGGSDATGASATIASVCRRAARIAGVTVVAPAARWAAVREAAGEGVELVEPGPGFLDRAAAADLVVSTASTTTWELACIGVPTVLLAAVPNQQHVYDAVVARGAARGLGTLSEVRADPRTAADRLGRAAADLLAGRSWAATGLALVDGLGARRVVEAWDGAVDDRAARG